MEFGGERCHPRSNRGTVNSLEPTLKSTVSRSHPGHHSSHPRLDDHEQFRRPGAGLHLGRARGDTGGEVGNPGVIGTLLPVSLPAALGDSISLSDGDVSFATNDVVVFAISLAGGSTSVDEIGIGVNSTPFFGNPVGAGAFASGGQLPDSVAASGVTLKATFSYNPTLLAAGSSSANLFATYSPAGSALAVGSIANISISSGTNFAVQTTLVPEPGTFLLVASGLAMLAMRRLPVHQKARPVHLRRLALGNQQKISFHTKWG